MKRNLALALLGAYAALSATVLAIREAGRRQQHLEAEGRLALKEAENRNLKAAERKLQSELRSLRASSGTLDQMAAALEGSPAAEVAPEGRSSRIRELLDAYADAQRAFAAGTGTSKEADDARGRIYAALRSEPESHLALMESLAAATTEDEVYDILGFLRWNPFVRSTTSREVTARIAEMAREIIARDTNPERRKGAMEVFLHYHGIGGDALIENLQFAIERWTADSDTGVREAWFESIYNYGPYPLPEAVALPIVVELGHRVSGGEYDLGPALAAWSTSDADFNLLRRTVHAIPDPGQKSFFLNAFAGDRAITRGWVSQSLEILIGLMGDPSEDAQVRDQAYSILRDTWIPWDAATEEALRQFETARGR